MQAFVSEAEHALLVASSVPFAVVETAQPLRTKFPRTPSAARILRALPDGYSTLSEINAFLAGVEEAYPTIARVLDAREFPPGITFEVRAHRASGVCDDAGARGGRAALPPWSRRVGRCV